MITKINDTTWEMFACEYTKKDTNELFYMHIGLEQYVKIHMLPNPIVKVVVTVNNNGKYLGWIETGKEELSQALIWPEHLFNMCFTYGYKAEEERGKGKAVRLDIRKKE